MKRIGLLISFLIGLITLNITYADNDTILPVVKIAGYKDVFGKYFEEVAEGSAFFINKEGYLVTSSNIVEDLERNKADYFNICLTKDYSLNPDCSYTASIVDYDKDLEVAILKLDKKDINGKDLDFTKLSILDIAYNYQIGTQDDVYTIGYTGKVGEYIAKKKGKFTGNATYNNHKYIKTDSLTSSINPGGAFLNKDSKVIGIPSVFVGGLLNPNMLYSIDINEVKAFIDKNLSKTPVSIINIDNFVKNKKQLDSISNTLKIKDSFINFSFTTDYEIKRYVENKGFILKPKNKNDTLVNYYDVSLEKNDQVATYEELLYFLADKGLYNKKTNKLSKRQIGFVDFTTITDTDTPGIEKTIYATRIGDKLAMVTISRNTFKDSNKEMMSKSAAENLLGSTSFNKDTFKDIGFTFSIELPKITISTGTFLSDTKGVGMNYYGTITDYLQLSVKDFLAENGKGKTISEIYKTDTSGISNDYKSMIKVSGHDGYIYCSSKDAQRKNEKGASMNQRVCVINIYGGFLGINSKEYYIKGILISTSKNMIDNLTKTISYLTNNLVINSIGDGKTKIPNVYKDIIPLKFNDLKYQSDNYKSVIKNLVKYKLLPNGLYLNPDDPVKWRDFVYEYFRYKYNYKFNTTGFCASGKSSCVFQNNYVDINGRKTSLATIFNEMKIPLDYYVDYDKAKVFPEYIELKLAGINAEYSEEWLKKYEKLKTSSVYSDIKGKVDTYNEKFFSGDEISIYDETGIDKGEDISYFQIKNTYFDFKNAKIFTKNIYKQGQYDFSSKNKKEINYCTGSYANKCYKVMTKSLMIDFLVPEMNFSIFDYSLVE